MKYQTDIIDLKNSIPGLRDTTEKGSTEDQMRQNKGSVNLKTGSGTPPFRTAKNF